MGDIIRDSALGEAVRLVFKPKLLFYPEDQDDFQVPESWKLVADTVKQPTETETQAFSSPDAEVISPAPHVEHHHLPGLEQLEGAIMRIKSRVHTRPWTVERFAIEQTEHAERNEKRQIIPQKTDEGHILVDWYTTDDPENPQNWTPHKKAWILFVIFIYTFAVYGGSSIYVTSEGGVMEAFGVGIPKASLGLAVYVLGYGCGPLIFGPMSEIPEFGRNVPYLISVALFTLLCIPTALVRNYAGLLVLRFLQGFVGSPCLANGGATMQDIYSFPKLPYAMSIWVLAAFCAPALTPTMSAYAVLAKSWRWSLWELLWMAAPVCIIMFTALPETSADRILLRRAQRLRALTGHDHFKSQGELDQAKKTFSEIAVDSILRPFQITLLDPAVAFVNLYTALIYGIYYSFFEVFPLVYPPMYGFGLGGTSLTFITIAVAAFFGMLIYFAYLRFYLEPDIQKHGMRAQEHRLVPALFSVFFLPAALFWFGWTASPHVHWIVGLIGLTFFGAAAFVLMQCIFMYLPLSYPHYAASLFAANDFFRALMAAGSIMYAHPLFVNLGVGPGVSLLAGIACLGVIFLWILYFKGATLRARSRFASS